jgi:hypothetical protein
MINGYELKSTGGIMTEKRDENVKQLSEMIDMIHRARNNYNTAIVGFIGEFIATSIDISKAIGEISAHDAFCLLMLETPKILMNQKDKLDAGDLYRQKDKEKD